MNWDAIGAIGEIIAASGVIASLIYLAVQLRHNTAQMEFTARTTQASAYQEITGRMIQNRQVMFSGSELPTLIEKLRTNEKLDRVEFRRYYAYVLSMVANADAAYFQFEQGLLTEKRLSALCQPLLRHMRQYPDSVEYWDRVKDEFVDEFREYLDASIARLKDSSSRPVETSFPPR